MWCRKALAVISEQDELAVALHAQFPQFAHRRFRLALCGAE